jgi:hypothetical protein
MTMRYLALHLPNLATDRLLRVEPDLPRSVLLATWAPFGNRRVLIAVNDAAANAGLRPRQALGDAQAIVPDLVLRPADPSGDAQALHALALWARRYTPLSAVDPPDGLILDITGCAHLLGGEAALLRDALSRLRRAGIIAQGAVSGAAATSAALSRTRDDNPLVVSGTELTVVAPLLLGAALRLSQTMLTELARLGLRRVRDLLGQPVARWPGASAGICWIGWMQWLGGGRLRFNPLFCPRTSLLFRTCWSQSSPVRALTPCSTGYWKIFAPLYARLNSAPAKLPSRLGGWMARCRRWQSALGWRCASRRICAGCLRSGWNGWSPI